MATAKTVKPKSAITVNGKRYKKVSCSTTKTRATAAAKAIRSKGGTARVLKQGAAHCVFQGPKAKAPFGRRKRTAKA